MAKIEATVESNPPVTDVRLAGALVGPGAAFLAVALASCRARAGRPDFTEADALALICRFYLESFPYEPYTTR